MLCAFSPNMGMGTGNMSAIEPPSILTDHLGLFAFYDRIYVDGQSFGYICGEYETRFFKTLIEAGIVEVRDGVYDEDDVRRCQAIFAAVFNRDFSEIFGGAKIDFSDAEPREFEQRLRRINPEIYAGYYLQLKNCCAMAASATLRCPIIGHHPTDLAIQQEILQHAGAGDIVREAVMTDPLAGAFGKLQATLDFEINDAPLSVNARGKRAAAMSAINQEVAPKRWPDWYAERCIDPIESGRRLEAFLSIRSAPYFEELQSWLIDAERKTGKNTWRAALQRDWAAIGKAELIAEMPD